MPWHGIHGNKRNKLKNSIVGMQTSVVQISNLHKAYRRGTTSTPVLRGVNLTIERGECVFLVGPSGCGKSTLLSILGCILSPDEGDVSLFGHDIRDLSESDRTQLRRDRVGFVFQRFHLIRGLNAYDNVRVPLRLQGVGARKARRRVLELLETVGLADHVHADPENLSAGQSQRVAFARALVSDPDLILADEPTASLDDASGQDAMTLLRKLIKEQHKTAIVVTHDTRIFRYADRVCAMHDGVLEEQQLQTTGQEN